MKKHLESLITKYVTFVSGEDSHTGKLFKDRGKFVVVSPRVPDVYIEVNKVFSVYSSVEENIIREKYNEAPRSTG